MHEPKIADPITRLRNIRDWQIQQAESAQCDGNQLQAMRHWGVAAKLNTEIERLERAKLERA